MYSNKASKLEELKAKREKLRQAKRKIEKAKQKKVSFRKSKGGGISIQAIQAKKAKALEAQKQKKQKIMEMRQFWRQVDWRNKRSINDYISDGETQKAINLACVMLQNEYERVEWEVNQGLSRDKVNMRYHRRVCMAQIRIQKLRNRQSRDVKNEGFYDEPVDGGLDQEDFVEPEQELDSVEIEFEQEFQEIMDFENQAEAEYESAQAEFDNMDLMDLSEADMEALAAIEAEEELADESAVDVDDVEYDEAELEAQAELEAEAELEAQAELEAAEAYEDDQQFRPS